MELHELMREVRVVELRTTKLVTGMFAGLYMSSFKGRGIEFDEVHEYNPGDDVRAIDWNVTARTNQPYIKRFVEEREMTVILAVDISASGDFGTRRRFKRDLATELTAVLSFSAVRNNDRVGIMLFTDEVQEFIPPRKGRKHVMQIIRTLLTSEPHHPGTNITHMLEYLNNVISRRGLVFIVSDFQSSDHYMRQLTITARRHDVVAVRISDPGEAELPDIGMIRLQDAETGEEILVDLSNRQVRELLKQQAEAQSHSYASNLRSLGIDTIEIGTDGRYIEELQAFFNNRIRRRERS